MDATIAEGVTLRYFRMIEGVRTPYLMVLDKRRNVVLEQVDQPALERMYNRTTFIPAPEPAEGSLLSQWVVAAIPNPIPGTDELRAQYFLDEAALLKKHEDAGTECPDCQRGSLMQFYRQQLKDAGLWPRS